MFFALPSPLSTLFLFTKNSKNYFSDIHVTVRLVCILLVFRRSQCCITNCIPLAPLPSRILDWCVCCYNFYDFWCDPDYFFAFPFFFALCVSIIHLLTLLNSSFDFVVIGGRNVTISLQSRAGHTHMATVVGLFVFTHVWFWFPLSHFISLAFTPACILGLNSDLKVSSS